MRRESEIHFCQRKKTARSPSPSPSPPSLLHYSPFFRAAAQQCCCIASQPQSRPSSTFAIKEREKWHIQIDDPDSYSPLWILFVCFIRISFIIHAFIATVIRCHCLPVRILSIQMDRILLSCTSCKTSGWGWCVGHLG